MQHTQVLKLAVSKGYKPVLCHIAKYGGSGTLPRTVTDEAEQLCELTLIQKWLRDEHKKYLTVIPSYSDNRDNKKCFFEIAYGNKVKQLGDTYGYFDTVELALFEGIGEALKLIP